MSRPPHDLRFARVLLFALCALLGAAAGPAAARQDRPQQAPLDQHLRAELAAGRRGAQRVIVRA